MTSQETQAQPQRQSFSKAEIKTLTVNEGTVQLEIPILSAELETGDRIIIPGDQPGRYDHPPIAGQTVLATIELISRQPQDEGLAEKIHIVKVTDEKNGDYQRTVAERARSKSLRQGDFFLVSEKNTGIDGIAYIPNSTTSGLLGKDSNFEWMNYPFDQADLKSPIKSEDHRLIISIIDGSIAVMPMGYESAAERTIPNLVDKSRVIVTTVATPEHKALVEAQLDQPQPMPIRKKAAERLLKLVRP